MFLFVKFFVVLDMMMISWFRRLRINDEDQLSVLIWFRF